ncbi:MAG: HIT family protein [Candidatus Aenigmarchaeota archaeon]|nr:HIT family protein [Candidatus Aenigmarchaeota archaeon]
MAEECIFCKIAKGHIPAKKVYEDESVMAFLDINPRNPGHTLVIPKGHYETLFDMPPREAAGLFERVRNIAVSVKESMTADGISISQSNGKAAGQVVPHMHFHIIPRFNSEGPAGLEGMLPVKRMEDKALDKIADAIKKAKPSEDYREEKPAREEPEEEKPRKKEEKKKKPEPEDDEFEELDLENFEFE